MIVSEYFFQNILHQTQSNFITSNWISIDLFDSLSYFLTMQLNILQLQSVKAMCQQQENHFFITKFVLLILRKLKPVHKHCISR